MFSSKKIVGEYGSLLGIVSGYNAGLPGMTFDPTYDPATYTTNYQGMLFQNHRYYQMTATGAAGANGYIQRNALGKSASLGNLTTTYANTDTHDQRLMLIIRADDSGSEQLVAVVDPFNQDGHGVVSIQYYNAGTWTPMVGMENRGCFTTTVNNYLY